MSVDVQEVFNKVIDAGLYWGAGGAGCSYMCNALRGAAREAGVISQDEFNAALDEVQQYVACLAGDGDPQRALAGVFHLYFDSSAYLDGDFTELYRDWANRPMPEPLHSQPETHLD